MLFFNGSSTVLIADCTMKSLHSSEKSLRLVRSKTRALWRVIIILRLPEQSRILLYEEYTMLQETSSS